MRTFKWLFLLILLASAAYVPYPRISDYIVSTGYGKCRTGGEEVILLRKFNRGNYTYYLAVSPTSLHTSVIRSDSLRFNAATWATIGSLYASTPYIRALKQAMYYSNPLQDAGFRHFLPSQHGIDLTVDLCPSKRPLDRIVFADLIKELGQVEKPVPIAISITGRWMDMHPGDLSWLEELVRERKLAVVWINHSFHHFTDKNIPLKRNFLLEPGTDIKSEVLCTEIALLERNIIPSVFFRFPGLVSDTDIYDKIVNFGLIPVASDAWLAKGQKPGEGSIVLIHANGNEPVGIRDFLDLLREEKQNVLSGRWELFDLRESVIADVSK